MLSSQLETLEKNTSRVCSKLKSMAALQFGDKWSTTSESPQKNTILTAVLRTIYYWNDSLEMSVADFNATLEEAFTLIYECIEKHPHFVADEQNSLTRYIVQLTDNVSNVKMAIIRQKGAYLNDKRKEIAKQSLDDVITYIADTMNDISETITQAGIKQKIDHDYRARKYKSRNPVIIPTDSTSSETSNNLHIDMISVSPTFPNENVSELGITPPPTNAAPPPPGSIPTRSVNIVVEKKDKDSDSDSDNINNELAF